jgi:hypothetical protein
MHAGLRSAPGNHLKLTWYFTFSKQLKKIIRIALSEFRRKYEKGFRWKAIFDNNPAVIGDVIEGKVIQPVTELSSYLSFKLRQ